ncbi:hypothetical protein BDW42DRAFT_180188 [Aspergillus taichungensis]|uniref:Uncharacterized protein n=1 Tax=Aspergillus taichungensis TaxID=482145 RepID=A0A2J5HFR3_9EURO|nr:hypothetical protein BDW42DRAFT_180188 [Aspergillus taichungensis]
MKWNGGQRNHRVPLQTPRSSPGRTLTHEQLEIKDHMKETRCDNGVCREPLRSSGALLSGWFGASTFIFWR